MSKVGDEVDDEWMFVWLLFVSFKPIKVALALDAKPSQAGN